MKLRVLLALLTVLSMCFFQVRSSLIVTTKVLAAVYYLQCKAMNLVLGLQDLFPVGADSDDCAFVGVKFHLPGFFPSLKC